MSPPAETSDDPTIDPTHVHTQADYHFALGEALSFDGESEKAIEEFKLATVYDAQSASIRLRLGNEYLKQGLLTEALEQAEQAYQMDQESVEVQLFLGGLYTALKMYRPALEHYQFALKKEPENADILLNIGALFAEEERFDEAENYFMKATRLPENEKKHLAYYYMGLMREGQGAAHYKQAEKAYTDGLQNNPEFDEGVLVLAGLYTKQGKKEKAYKLLESFQEQFGPKKNIAYELQNLYLEDENYDKAYKHLVTLESYEPQILNIKVKIALILIEKKKYDEAIVKLEEIINIEPSSDKIRFWLAAVYEEKNNVDLAIRNFQKIEGVSTYFADAVVHAAFLYRKKHDLKSAGDLLQKSIAVRDDVPQFYAFYASVLDELREYKKGISMLERGLKKFPDDTQIRFYLGSMYDRVGRTDDTIVEMRKVIAIDENHVQAINYLAYTFAEGNINLEEAETLAAHAAAHDIADIGDDAAGGDQCSDE